MALPDRSTARSAGLSRNNPATASAPASPIALGRSPGTAVDASCPKCRVDMCQETRTVTRLRDTNYYEPDRQPRATRGRFPAFAGLPIRAGHSDPRTTRIYDRRRRKVTRNIVERISI
jgi:hypothetical protein